MSAKKRKRYICYLITNKSNGMKYVGITSKTLKQRMKAHKHDAVHNNKTKKFKLHNALNKYGVENFSIKILKRAASWEEICQIEQEYIKKLKTNKRKNGYNLTLGGEGVLGLKCSDTTRKKLSEIRKESWKDPNYRNKVMNGNKKRWGKRKEREKAKRRSTQLWEQKPYRQKTSKAIKEAWKSEETKRKQKEGLKRACTNNNEWRKKTKEKNKKLAQDPNWRAKVSEGLKKAHEQNPDISKKKSKTAQQYWNEGHNERREKHAQTMSTMINKKLKDPEYQKWRKENPPNGKPILYKRKYFRSIQEAVDYFKISRSKITMDLLKKRRGCKKLDPNKTYNFEIKYNEK